MNWMACRCLWQWLCRCFADCQRISFLSFPARPFLALCFQICLLALLVLLIFFVTWCTLSFTTSSSFGVFLWHCCLIVLQSVIAYKLHILIGLIQTHNTSILTIDFLWSDNINNLHPCLYMFGLLLSRVHLIISPSQGFAFKTPWDYTVYVHILPEK